MKVERYSPIDNTKILSNCVKELFQSAFQLIVLHSSLVRQTHKKLENKKNFNNECFNSIRGTYLLPSY